MKKFLFILPILALAGFTAKAQMQHTVKGALYQIYTHNTGEKIKLNDVITFQFIQKTDKDSVLFSTYTAGKPVQAQIQASQNVGDLMDIFPLLTVNDSAMVKVPTDSIFKGHEEARPPFFPKASYLTFILKIQKVQSMNEAIAEHTAAVEKLKSDEAVGANAYITAHNLHPVSTPSGLKYIITQPSAKRKPLAGDTLLVNYTGRTLNGKVFDSSVEANAKAAGLQQPGRTYEPISVVVGAQQVIPGWDEGLLLLNEGSKATFIIPSTLAYGEKGAGQDIAPYSTLVFDVELVSVKPGKHVATAVKPGASKYPVKKPVARKGVATKKKN